MTAFARALVRLLDGAPSADPHGRDPQNLRRLRTVRGCLLSICAAAPFAAAMFVAIGAWLSAALVAVSSALSVYRCASCHAVRRSRASCT